MKLSPRSASQGAHTHRCSAKHLLNLSPTQFPEEGGGSHSLVCQPSEGLGVARIQGVHEPTRCEKHGPAPGKIGGEGEISLDGLTAFPSQEQSPSLESRNRDKKGPCFSLY